MSEVMSKMCRYLVYAIALVTVTACGTGPGAPSPSHGLPPQRNGQILLIPDRAPRLQAESWRFQTPHAGELVISLSASSGLVAVGTGDERGVQRVFGLDPVTGKVRWRTELPGSFRLRRVAVSTDGRRIGVGGLGRVYLLNQKGDLLWFRAVTPIAHLVQIRPDGGLLVGTYDPHHANHPGQVYSFGPDGQVEWSLPSTAGMVVSATWDETEGRAVVRFLGESQTHLVDRKGTVLPGGPAESRESYPVGERNVTMANDQEVAAFDAAGAVLWRAHIESPDRPMLTTSSDGSALLIRLHAWEPEEGKDRSYLWALTPDGRAYWHGSLDGFAHDPALDGGAQRLLFFCCKNQVRAYRLPLPPKGE